MANSQWTHHGDLPLLEREFEHGNPSAPYAALEYCRMERKPVPAWAVDAILYQHRSRRAPRDWQKKCEQRFSDDACFAMVKMLRMMNKHPESRLHSRPVFEKVEEPGRIVLKVRHLQEKPRKLTWDQTYTFVAQAMQLSPEAVKHAYRRVLKRAK